MPPTQQQHHQQAAPSSSVAGTLATCYTRTFLQEIPASVQREMWRTAPNELRRLLALAPRTMLFAHRALSSICHPHLSTVAWRCDLSTRLTAAEAEEDLLPWKVNAAAEQQAKLAAIAKSRRVSREAQAAAYHGSVVPAEPSCAALGTRRFKAMCEALRGDVTLQEGANAMDRELADNNNNNNNVTSSTTVRSGDTELLVLSSKINVITTGTGDNDEHSDASRSTTDAAATDRDEEEEEEESRGRPPVSLPDKWMLLTEVHAQIRMSNTLVDVPAPPAPADDDGNEQQQQQPQFHTVKKTARQVSAECIADWRRSPLVLSMLRIIFQRLATVPSETALKNSGVSGGVSALKRALSVRFGVEDSTDTTGSSNQDGSSVSLNINAAVLPSDFALLSNPEQQRDGTLSRKLSRIFGAGPRNDSNNNNNNADSDDDDADKKQKKEDPLVDSYVSVASYILFQQRLFSILFHATADEQVVCAALLDFIADADYVGGGSLSRMTTDVGKSDSQMGAGGVDHITAASNARKSMHSFRRLSSVGVDKINFDSASSHHAPSSDPFGGGAGASSLSVSARNQLLLNSVPQMKEMMRDKVLSAARSIAGNNKSSSNGSTAAATAVAAPLLGGALGAALATAREQQQQHHASAGGAGGTNGAANGGVFALTQGEFEDALDATFINDTQQQKQQQSGGGVGGAQAADRAAGLNSGGSKKGKWSSKNTSATSSSAHLLHVRDFSKFGVFYEKFAKFMFELCDNWAASHSVDGIAAFLGFIARAAFPSPIDTIWQRNLPLILRNEMKEKLRKLAELQAATLESSGGGGSVSLDAQLDMMEALAAEEAAIEAGLSDPSGKRSAGREKQMSEKEKFESLQLSAASWKGEKKKPGGKKKKKGDGSADASEFDGIALPEIVVHSPTMLAEAAASGSGDQYQQQEQKKKRKKKVTFRFNMDDYGSDTEGDDDDEDDGDGRVAVVHHDGADADKKKEEHDDDAVPAVDSAATTDMTVADGGGGAEYHVDDGEEDPRKLLRDHLRRKREREQREREEDEALRRAAAEKGEEAEEEEEEEQQQTSAADDPCLETTQSQEQQQQQQQPSGKDRHSLPVSTESRKQQQQEVTQKPEAVLAPSSAAGKKPGPKFVPAPPPPSQQQQRQQQRPATTTSTVERHPSATNNKDRFRERRAWFRGSGDGGEAEMRNWPVQVERSTASASSASSSRRHALQQQHPHNPIYDVVPHVSPTGDASFFSSNNTSVMTQTQQPMTVWWKPDNRECVKARLVRPFEERRLVKLGLPVPPPKRK